MDTGDKLFTAIVILLMISLFLLGARFSSISKYNEIKETGATMVCGSYHDCIKIKEAK